MVAAAASRTQISCAIWLVMRRSGRQAHQPQGLLHLLVVHDFQKRRLLKLDGEPLAQRAVEDRIAGGVGEVGEHQHIFVRERFGLRALLPKEDPATCQNEHGNGSDPVLQQGIVALAGSDRTRARFQRSRSSRSASSRSSGAS